MVLPIALVCSTRLPVSVLVRAPKVLLRGFFQKYGITDFTQLLRLMSQVNVSADFHADTPYTLSRGRPEPRSATLLRRPIGSSAVNTAREYLPVVRRLRLSPSP